MKIIELTQGLVALVDDDDFERLNKFKWCAHRNQLNFYAVRQVPTGLKKGPKQKTIRMHQEVLPGVTLVDHKNRFGLDNRKQNLRPSTVSQNNINRRLLSSNTSGYRGICWIPKKKQWQSRIRTPFGKRLFLGYHDTKESAARAYDAAAKKYHKEFAQSNFV